MPRDLAKEGEGSRPAYIATDLLLEEEELLIKTLKEYKDVFAWSYRDLKGVDPAIFQHTIPMKDHVSKDLTLIMIILPRE